MTLPKMTIMKRSKNKIPKSSFQYFFKKLFWKRIFRCTEERASRNSRIQEVEFPEVIKKKS